MRKTRTPIQGVGAKTRLWPPKEAEANAIPRPRHPNKGKAKDKTINQMGRQDAKDNSAKKAKANKTPMIISTTGGRRYY